jgi:hypothetical protein
MAFANIKIANTKMIILVIGIVSMRFSFVLTSQTI